MNIKKLSKEIFIGGTVCLVFAGITLNQISQINNLENEYKEIIKELNNSKNTIDAMEETITSFESENSSLQTKLTETITQLEDKEAEFKATKQRLDELESKIPRQLLNSATPSRGRSVENTYHEAYAFSKALNMEATAYCNCPICVGQWSYTTATGTTTTAGRTIAVDPNIIPLGTEVYLEFPNSPERNGFYVSEDTGGAIKGNIIDLYIPSHEECLKFGRQPIKMYILN